MPLPTKWFRISSTKVNLGLPTISVSQDRAVWQWLPACKGHEHSLLIGQFRSPHRPLIGPDRSRDLNTGLWLATGQHKMPGWRQPPGNVRHTWRHASQLPRSRSRSQAGRSWELCQHLSTAQWETLDEYVVILKICCNYEEYSLKTLGGVSIAVFLIFWAYIPAWLRCYRGILTIRTIYLFTLRQGRLLEQSGMLELDFRSCVLVILWCTALLYIIQDTQIYDGQWTSGNSVKIENMFISGQLYSFLIISMSKLYK